MRMLDLSGHDLRSTTFTKSNLEGALLNGANLEAASLPKCVLCGASLQAAYLQVETRHPPTILMSVTQNSLLFPCPKPFLCRRHGMIVLPVFSLCFPSE